MPDILNNLKDRWSPRAFADTMPSRDSLACLFEAARWAPSCYNDQPWYFVVATRDDHAKYDAMLGCLVEFNQSWASTAPVLMVSVARDRFERNEEPNRHAWFDVGLATGNLLAQAQHLGMLVHQMAGFDADQARSTLAIPEHYSPVAAAAIGYLGAPERLPEGMDEKDPATRERKSLDEFVFAGRWGERF